MTVIPEGFGEVVLYWQSPDLDGSLPVMTFGVSVSDTVAPEDVEALYDSIISNGVLTNVQSSWALIKVKITYNLGGLLLEASHVETTAGGEGGTAVAAQVAALIKKETGVAGRKHRGRMYQPGLGQSDFAQSGVLSSTVQSQLTGAWVGVANDLAGGDLAPIGAMYVLHTDPEDDPTQVSQIACESSAATQRRRARH